nr:uncharacterized protein LOC111513692 [Leptinotarsa decemlineata]
MKAFKSLEAHKYFTSGFVLKARTKVINDFYVLVGKVKHSQRTNAKPLDVWCIVTMYGSIATANCTCVAGASEVCSHVGAILFAAEYAYQKKNSSCNDFGALWSIPCLSTVMPIEPLSKMDCGQIAVPSTMQQKTAVPQMTESDIVNLLTRIETIGKIESLMRIIEPFASKISGTVNMKLAFSLDIYQQNYKFKTYIELMQISKSINLCLKQEQCNEIEKITRKQHATNNYYLHRVGRITASKFKSVCRTNKESPSHSLVESICYPIKILFSLKLLLGGLNHEKIAVKKYKECMEENHISFIIL